jgi:endonuclease YncB( thermonuclease family)
MSDAPTSIADLPEVFFSEDGMEWAVPVGARVAKPSPKPFNALAIANHDGDTLRLHVPGWPGVVQKIGCRVLGVDTPEMTDTRPELLKLAKEAQAFTADKRKRTKNKIVLHDAKGDKYFRLLGRVEFPRIGMLDELLIEAGLGRPYFGVNPKPWDRGL